MRGWPTCFLLVRWPRRREPEATVPVLRHPSKPALVAVGMSDQRALRHIKRDDLL